MPLHSLGAVRPAPPGRVSNPKTLTISLLAGVLVALTSGCASQRISSSLERYGVPPDKAECVGDSLASRLSTAQLQALGRAANAYKAVDRSSVSLTLVDLARVAAELRDPVIPIEITRAGVQCFVLSPGAT